MILKNPAGPIDLQGQIFGKGETREFGQLEAEDLLKRYPRLEVVAGTPEPKPSPAKVKVGRPRKSLTKKK